MQESLRNNFDEHLPLCQINQINRASLENNATSLTRMKNTISGQEPGYDWECQHSDAHHFSALMRGVSSAEQWLLRWAGARQAPPKLHTESQFRPLRQDRGIWHWASSWTNSSYDGPSSSRKVFHNICQHHQWQRPGLKEFRKTIWITPSSRGD